MVQENMLRESPGDYRQSPQTCEPKPPAGDDCQRWARSTHARIKDWLPRDRSTPILDLGCGEGYFLHLMDELGYTDVSGVDLNPARVRLAQRLAPRARVCAGDARGVLADNPGRFGLITAFDVLEHVPKQEILPLLDLAAKALSRGGRVIIQTPNGESPWMGTVGYGDFTHECFFTPASLAQLLNGAGLTGFAVRECGPLGLGVKSFVRLLLWQFLRAAMLSWNLVETGMAGSGICTRVFLATALKPSS
jgi:SAM-dependent methyltransferase